jgi:hypothetical protein
MSERINISALRQLARLDWHALEGQDYIPLQPHGPWSPIPVEVMRDLVAAGMATELMGWCGITPAGYRRIGWKKGRV